MEDNAEGWGHLLKDVAVYLLDLGLEEAGHEVILQVERDPHCVQVLQHRFPGRELHTDVAGIHALPPETELLAAGFPCQV